MRGKQKDAECVALRYKWLLEVCAEAAHHLVQSLTLV